MKKYHTLEVKSTVCHVCRVKKIIYSVTEGQDRHCATEGATFAYDVIEKCYRTVGKVSYSDLILHMVSKGELSGK